MQSHRRQWGCSFPQIARALGVNGIPPQSPGLHEGNPIANNPNTAGLRVGGQRPAIQFLSAVRAALMTGSRQGLQGRGITHRRLQHDDRE